RCRSTTRPSRRRAPTRSSRASTRSPSSRRPRGISSTRRLPTWRCSGSSSASRISTCIAATRSAEASATAIWCASSTTAAAIRCGRASTASRVPAWWSRRRCGGKNIRATAATPTTSLRNALPTSAAARPSTTAWSKYRKSLDRRRIAGRGRIAVRSAADLYYWEWDAATDRMHWSRNPEVLPALAGGTAQTWSEYAQMVHPDDRERYLATGRGAVARGVPFDIEYRVATADGRLVWFGLRGVPMFDPAGKVYRMVGVSQDVTARKRREDAVRFLAYHDSLTGLPNRRLLDDRLKQAVHLAQRRDRKVAAMLIDLDNFKQVNDSFGHRAGDAVLKEVAQRLAACVRRADTLARHGGDEFVVVISEVNAEADCQIVADKILHALAAEFHVDGRALALGASIGVSLYPTDAGDGDALLRNADAAMYRAKQLGRNQYRFYGR